MKPADGSIRRSLFGKTNHCLKKHHSNIDHAPHSTRAGIKRRLTVRIGIRQPATRMLVVLILLMCSVGWSQDTNSNRPSKIAPPFRTDRILVKPKAGIPPATLAGFHLRYRASVLNAIGGENNLQVIRLPNDETVQSYIQKCEQSGLVEYAEPDYIVRIAATFPNDPRFLDGTLWGLNNTGQSGGVLNADIDAPEGWDLLTSASNIVVAVLDTGVRYAHEDLSANLWVMRLCPFHPLVDSSLQDVVQTFCLEALENVRAETTRHHRQCDVTPPQELWR